MIDSYPKRMQAARSADDVDRSVEALKVLIDLSERANALTRHRRVRRLSHLVLMMMYELSAKSPRVMERGGPPLLAYLDAEIASLPARLTPEDPASLPDSILRNRSEAADLLQI